MADGLGAGFFALTLVAVLLAIAGLLVVTTAIASLRYDGAVPRSVELVAASLAGVVVAVSGFGIAVLVDEAIRVATLLVAIVSLPLALVAGRTRVAGAPWITTGALSGMAWGLAFPFGVGVLFVLQTTTEISTSAMTGLAGVTTTAGTLLVGEYVRGSLDATAR